MPPHSSMNARAFLAESRCFPSGSLLDEVRHGHEGFLVFRPLDLAYEPVEKNFSSVSVAMAVFMPGGKASRRVFRSLMSPASSLGRSCASVSIARCSIA